MATYTNIPLTYSVHKSYIFTPALYLKKYNPANAITLANET